MTPLPFLICLLLRFPGSYRQILVKNAPFLGFRIRWLINGIILLILRCPSICQQLATKYILYSDEINGATEVQRDSKNTLTNKELQSNQQTHSKNTQNQKYTKRQKHKFTILMKEQKRIQNQKNSQNSSQQRHTNDAYYI